MSSFVFYPLLYTVFETLPQAKLNVLYVEAADYYPSEQEWSGFLRTIDDPTDALELAERYQEVSFQSKGAEAIYGSDVFPGRNVGPLATQLIAMPNFGLERIKGMIAYAEAQFHASTEQIKWLLGRPPNQQKNGWRLDALDKLYNADKYGEAIPVSTRNYHDTFRVLEDIWGNTNLDRQNLCTSFGDVIGAGRRPDLRFDYRPLTLPDAKIEVQSVWSVPQCRSEGTSGGENAFRIRRSGSYPCHYLLRRGQRRTRCRRIGQNFQGHFLQRAALRLCRAL
jgi:hypothetical protein